MKQLDLTQYGIVGTTEIVHNPSYEVLFAEETKAELTGFDKGQETELGAVNVMTGVYTGRSPKDKFIVDDAQSHDNVWWTSENYKNDNKPMSEATWAVVKDIAIKELSNKRLFVVDAFCGTNPDSRIAVRFFVITEEYDYEIEVFSDTEDHWASEYINMAYLLGIINGYPDGTYRPSNIINRAEAMTIVNNTLRRSPCREGLLSEDVMIMWPDNMNTRMWYYAAVQEATNSHEFGHLIDNTGHEGHHDFAHCEEWTELLPGRDWAAFEKAWSDANSASNPGEGVDGKDGTDALD